MTRPRILLLGAGRTAVPSLQRLVASEALQAVVVPDQEAASLAFMQGQADAVQRPLHGVKRESLAASLETLCEQYQPDAVFVIGFPWRVPATVLDRPQFGFLNFHGGPLPELRGPDPIFEAIRQQRTDSALTVHRMVTALDAGAVLLEDRFPLPADWTYGLLLSHLAYRAAEASAYLAGQIGAGALPVAIPQDPTAAQYWHRVRPEDLCLRWQTQPAEALAALIRACNPTYGGAPTLAGPWGFRIVDATVLPERSGLAAPGTLLALDPLQGALIQCLDGAVLQVRIIGTDEGYFPAGHLAGFGIQAGFSLNDPPPVALSTTS